MDPGLIQQIKDMMAQGKSKVEVRAALANGANDSHVDELLDMLMPQQESAGAISTPVVSSLSQPTPTIPVNSYATMSGSEAAFAADASAAHHRRKRKWAVVSVVLVAVVIIGSLGTYFSLNQKPYMLTKLANGDFKYENACFKTTIPAGYSIKPHVASGSPTLNENCAVTGKDNQGNEFAILPQASQASDPASIGSAAMESLRQGGCDSVNGAKGSNQYTFRITAHCPKNTVPYLVTYNFIGSQSLLGNYKGSNSTIIAVLGFSKSPDWDNNIANIIVQNMVPIK